MPLCSICWVGWVRYRCHSYIWRQLVPIVSTYTLFDRWWQLKLVAYLLASLQCASCSPESRNGSIHAPWLRCTGSCASGCAPPASATSPLMASLLRPRCRQTTYACPLPTHTSLWPSVSQQRAAVLMAALLPENPRVQSAEYMYSQSCSTVLGTITIHSISFFFQKW
jgi:hypothetical protein